MPQRIYIHSCFIPLVSKFCRSQFLQAQLTYSYLKSVANFVPYSILLQKGISKSSQNIFQYIHLQVKDDKIKLFNISPLQKIISYTSHYFYLYYTLSCLKLISTHHHCMIRSSDNIPAVNDTTFITKYGVILVNLDNQLKQKFSVLKFKSKVLLIDVSDSHVQANITFYNLNATLYILGLCTACIIDKISRKRYALKKDEMDI